MFTSLFDTKIRAHARPFKVAGVAAVVLLPCSATALTIHSIVGDQDGFNGVYNPVTTPLPHSMTWAQVAANGSGEAAFTDGQNFHENQAPTYAHSWSSPAGYVLVAAAYEIVVYDNASQAQAYSQGHNGRLSIDGQEVRRGANQDFFFDAVGEHFGGASGSFGDGGAERFTVTLDASFLPLFLDGSASIQYYGSTGDEVAVDYSLLSLTYDQVIPLPQASLIAMSGLGVLAIRRRR